jgi:hypothetical protein
MMTRAELEALEQAAQDELLNALADAWLAAVDAGDQVEAMRISAVLTRLGTAW